MSDANGVWETVTNTPMGQQKGTLTLQVDGDKVTGTMAGAQGTLDIDGAADGDAVNWKAEVTSPMPMTLEFDLKAEGDAISGSVKTSFGNFPLNGTRKS